MQPPNARNAGDAPFIRLSVRECFEKNIALFLQHLREKLPKTLVDECGAALVADLSSHCHDPATALHGTNLGDLYAQALSSMQQSLGAGPAGDAQDAVIRLEAKYLSGKPKPIPCPPVEQFSDLTRYVKNKYLEADRAVPLHTFDTDGAEIIDRYCISNFIDELRSLRVVSVAGAKDRREAIFKNLFYYAQGIWTFTAVHDVHGRSHMS